MKGDTIEYKEIASQKKLHSIIESVVGTAIGFVINVYAQHIIFPFLGINIPWSLNLTIAAIFTGISIARGYLLRRVFNWIHVKHLKG